MNKNRWEIVTAILMTGLVLAAFVLPVFAAAPDTAEAVRVDLSAKVILTDKLTMP